MSSAILEPETKIATNHSPPRSTVLIVDDEEINRDLIRDPLEAKG